jgi:SpoVK/Ycf46/Vps4 family AAA+-type ATPase
LIYAERIDAAIKRQGRIDHHLLLLPPDRERRKQFIDKLWASRPIDANKAAEQSVFLGYNDLESISVDATGTTALNAIAVTTPAIRPDAYVARFEKKDGNLITDIRRTPFREFIAMVALEVDATNGVRGTPEWKRDIESRCRQRFGSKPHPNLDEELSTFLESTR